jgi:RNA polymerase primary sigma factor
MSYDTIDQFMQRAVKIPLLTPTEEIHLARSVQRMMAIQDSNPSGPYTKTESADIRRGTRAKERFISANIRLVASVAAKYHRALNSSLDLQQEDLMQEGMFGLVRAVEKFDPERGYKFSTYAYWWIRQSIVRGMQVNGRTIKLPTHIHEKMFTLRQRQHSLSLKLGRAPSMQELADELALPLDLLEHVLLVGTRPTSLDAAVGDNDSPLMDAISDDGTSADQLNRLSDDLDIERLRHALKQLPKRDQQILELRFGLNGNQPETLHAIGVRYGITRERVRQLCTNALRRIERDLAADPQFRISLEWRCDGVGAAKATPPPHTRHEVTVSATKTPLLAAVGTLPGAQQKETPADPQMQQGQQPTAEACLAESSRQKVVRIRNRNAMISRATTPRL